MEVLPTKHQQTGIVHCDHVGRSRLFVDDRHFAKEAAFTKYREDDLAAILCNEHHLDLTGGNQKECVTGIVFEHNHAALGVAALSSQISERSQVRLAEPGEQRDL